MKTAAKIFVIVGMVLGAWGIFPLLIGIFALDKLDTATDVKDIKGWGVAVLILVNLIAGIIMLMMTNEQLSEGKRKESLLAASNQLEGKAYQHLGATKETEHVETNAISEKSGRKSQVMELEMYDEL